jgi:hypothetical protein
MMDGPMQNRSATLRSLSAAILIVGAAAALGVYIHAVRVGPPAADSLEDNKQYLRQMEYYGGKGNVLAEQIREWLASLWHGKSLAFTVAFLAVLVAGGFRLAAIELPPLEPEDAAATGKPRQGV